MTQEPPRPEPTHGSIQAHFPIAGAALAVWLSACAAGPAPVMTPGSGQGPGPGSGPASGPSLAQTSALDRPVLVRNKDALLSEDQGRARAIEDSVAAFLRQASTGEFTDDLVDPAEIDRHGFFFRRVTGFSETPGIGVPSILKAYTLDDENYFVTVAFGGEDEGVPFLDMIVELKATPYGNGYRFHSPFEDRTANFGKTRLGDVRFHYSGDFDEERARRFVATRAELAAFSRKTLEPLEYYAFESLDEMLKSYGLVFDEDRCNFLGHDLARFDDGGRRYLTGMGDECYMFGYAGRFLAHDDYDRAERYGTMAAGFSTLYGGYWLVGTPMEELRAELHATIVDHPEMDLVEVFKLGRNGQTIGHAPSFVMAALLCEEVIETRGYDDLLRLMYTGRKGERFFAELQDVLGVDEASFRDAIVGMLESEAPVR